MLIPEGTPLFDALAEPARDARMVFFAGLPGTGKSLLIRELAHLAHARGRAIHLLQWDVARPVFETCEAGRRYPQEAGVTHGIIRLAVGGWAREAVQRWHTTHPPAALLIGETPFIGNRLVELARRAADAAEPLLASAAARFVVPVPSRPLRAHLEAERERRTREPRHHREREDAPPLVLRALWREIAGGEQPYDPDVYRGAYEAILVHRHVTVLLLDTILPVGTGSAYDLRVPVTVLVPGEDEAAVAVEAAERRHPTAVDVARAIERWRDPVG